MVDRLEELLALLEDEDDEDEREDELGLRAAVPAAPASEIETEEMVEGGGEKAADFPVEDEGALAEAEAWSWMPDGKMRSVSVEEQDRVPGADGSDETGAIEDGAVEREAAEFWWDELAAPVMGQNGSMVLRRPGAGDVEISGPAGAAKETGAAEELGAVMESMRPAEKGLEGLYRQAVQASRPAAQSLPVEQAGRTVRAEEPGRTAALTVDELDRAVRRDSRRYDGGMTIF